MGREHIGQTTFAPQPQTGNLRDCPFLGLGVSPNDIQALRNYTEQYDYDAVGNFETMIHVAQNGNWTRKYSYNDQSLLENGKLSNRLSSTQIGSDPNEPYLHDAHGNIVKMPHLLLMEWDFKDQLHASQQQVVNNGGGEKTYYVYDASGQRSRKVTERQNSTRKSERFYLGGFEVYREYDGSGENVTLERETLHVMDDKQRIALIETRTQGNDGSPQQLVRYQFSNHLGSASLELDNSAQIISYEEYFPYGSTSYQASRSGIEATPKRYRYTGIERDEENGFNYHGARYYANWLGIWTSCDPAGLADGLNLYEMAHRNPIRFADLTGNENTETTVTVPAVQNYLKTNNIPFAKEVTFDYFDPSGDVVPGRFDIVFKDPQGRLVFPELKGLKVDKLHGNQKRYSDQLAKEGGTIRLTSDRMAHLGYGKGSKITITKEQYLPHGKNGCKRL